MNYLLWVDLETTGLDPSKCSVIEAAWAVTPHLHNDYTKYLRGNDGHLAVSSNVIFADELTYWEDVAKKMHQENSLYDACRLMSNQEEGVQSLRVVESKMNDALNSVTTNDNTFYLAGSSVHFDMSFLHVHMPSVAKRLSHRLFDVSAMKLFMESLGYEFKSRTDKPHRAAADLFESWKLYQLCVKLRYQAGLRRE